MNSKLTLNLGVRYELTVPFQESNNIVTGFDPESKSIINGADWETMYKAGASTPAITKVFTDLGMTFIRPKDVGLPNTLIYLNKMDFNPRIGFAYKFSDDRNPLVIRGGYSIFGYDMPLRAFDARMRQNPPTTAAFTYQLSNTAQNPDGKPNYLLRSTPMFIAGENTQGMLDPSRPGGVSRGSMLLSYFDPEQPTSRAHEWNFTIEKEIFANMVARAGYVGTHGSRMDMYYSYNQAPSAMIWYHSCPN